MPRLERHALLLGACIAAASCGDFVLPEPPEVAHLAARYDNPTIQITKETVESAIQTYLELRSRLGLVGDLEMVVNALVAFDESVQHHTSEDQTFIEIGGIPVRADAELTLTADCPGWSEVPDRDAVSLTAVVQSSRIAPVVWGAARDCRVERSPERTRFSAQLITYLPSLNLAGKEAQTGSIYVSYDVEQLEVDGQSQPTWRGDFRFTEARLEILVTVFDSGTAVLYGDEATGELGVRAANGAWRCLVPQRRCESADGTSLLSY